MRLLRLSICALAGLAACTSDPAPASATDAPRASDGAASDGVAPDTAVAPPATCPSTGAGALIPANSSCWVFTPTDSHAASDGENADVAQYALAPTTGARGYLVIFLNPSLGSPGQSIATPTDNIYNASVAAGDHVLAIAYASDLVIGVSCSGDDACYTDTRTAGITGVAQPHQAAGFTIVKTAGIHERVALALSYLRASDPRGGWGPFYLGGEPTDPSGAAIDWSKVIIMGHSQGGGYAAMLAKLHPVARMVALSSPCDAVGDAPATWQTTGTWATAMAQRGYGFGASADTTCPLHTTIWNAIGIPNTAPQRDDNAVTCRGASPHTAPTQCTANMDEIRSLVTM